MYDGRAHDDRLAFRFNNTDFNHLSSWPLYHKGLVSELPDDSIVSVSYSLGTYKGVSGTVVSSNIQLFCYQPPSRIMSENVIYAPKMLFVMMICMTLLSIFFKKMC